MLETKRFSNFQNELKLIVTEKTPYTRLINSIPANKKRNAQHHIVLQEIKASNKNKPYDKAPLDTDYVRLEENFGETYAKLKKDFYTLH